MFSLIPDLSFYEASPFAELVKQAPQGHLTLGQPGPPAKSPSEVERLKAERDPFIIKNALTSEQIGLAQSWMTNVKATLGNVPGEFPFKSRLRLSYQDILYEETRVRREAESLEELLHAKWPLFPRAEQWTGSLLAPAIAHFGVPTNACISFFMRYFTGSSLCWHTDIEPILDPGSSKATVSMSVLLSEPGREFTGGNFETPSGIVPLSIGDAVAITGRTRHRVTAVTSGMRNVLVILGGLEPADSPTFSP